MGTRFRLDSMPRIARALLLCALALSIPAGCRGQKETIAVANQKPAIAPVRTETASAHSAFDAARAFELAKRQVAFGPRPAGTPALAETRKFLVSELTSYGLKVTEEPFTAETPAGKIAMVNVVAELAGTSPDVLVIGSHYDTKRMKDFVGANDGASSTAALLEIARVVAEQSKAKKPDLTLQFVLFDGEEAVVEWEGTDNTYGSRQFVASRKANGSIAKIRGMVLLDMIGDKDLNIFREANSTRPLTDVIWGTAAALGYGAQFPNESMYIEDDHVPFLQAGIPSVDLIDFHFGTDRNHGDGGLQNAYWHTTNDTLDKISAESLKIVGDTVIVALPKIMSLVKQ